MSRCISTDELEVHHINRYGGNQLGNAQVLCHSCHENTGSYGKEGNSPPEFSEKTKEAAKIRADYRCECEKDNCHINENELLKAVINASKYN